MSLYVGINNSPRAITNLLVGNSGVREVQSAYTGGLILGIRYMIALI